MSRPGECASLNVLTGCAYHPTVSPSLRWTAPPARGQWEPESIAAPCRPRRRASAIRAGAMEGFRFFLPAFQVVGCASRTPSFCLAAGHTLAPGSRRPHFARGGTPAGGNRAILTGSNRTNSQGGDLDSTRIAKPEGHAEVQEPRKTSCKSDSCQRRQLRSGRLSNGQPPTGHVLVHPGFRGSSLTSSRQGLSGAAALKPQPDSPGVVPARRAAPGQMQRRG